MIDLSTDEQVMLNMKLKVMNGRERKKEKKITAKCIEVAQGIHNDMYFLSEQTNNLFV